MPCIGICSIPSTCSGCGMPAASRIVGADVDDVRELAAQAAPVLDPRRPGDDHRVAGAAEVRGDLLAPLERRVAGPGPGAGEVGLHDRAAPGVDAAVGSISLSCCSARERNAVERGHLVERAGLRAFHARAVVAPDVEDQRVVELAQLLDRVDDAADLVVGVLLEAGEDLHLPGVELLLRPAERVPGREGRVARRELGIRPGSRPAAFCRANVSSRSLSQPWSNLPLYLSAHSFGTWCGAVRGAGGVVDEERLVGRLGLLVVQPVRSCGRPGRRGGNSPSSFGHADDRVVLGQNRVVLAGCAAEEAAEVVEARGRSASGRTGRRRPAGRRA